MDCDAERIWKTVENHRHNVPKKKRSPGAVLSLFDHLYDCYVDCTQRQNDKNYDKRFRNTNNLLQQISPDHAHLSLVVNLYSDERGYSLILNPDQQSEEIFLPYEDNEIFSYLDNQEIPPVLMEVLSHTTHCHMYGGCIVCEVRNYRTTPHITSPLPYDSHLLLLRPTTESILQMVNEIATETECSMEERLLLESKLLLATQPPICLEPSTEVVWVTNRLHYNRGKFHTPSMRRYLRRRSQARRARMYYSSLQRAPKELRLHDFITSNNTTLTCPRSQFVDVWKKRDVAQGRLSSSSAAAIARRVQELASIPEPAPPTPSYLTSPSIDHTPSLPSPTRSHGQITAEAFLVGRRQPTTPISTMPPQVGVVSPTIITSPHPQPHRAHTSPVHKTTPTTTVSTQPPQKLPPPKKSVPRIKSLTISLPRIYTSRGRANTVPTSTPALQTTPTTALPTPPTSLRVTSTVSKKRLRPIAPAPPVVAMTAGNNNTPQHPTAAVKSSIRVITTSNQKSTSIQFGIRSLPKLRRVTNNLPPLPASIQHLQISMPKLHRLATPSLPTPALSHLPNSKTASSSSAQITMPVLHRLATENGTISPATHPQLKTVPPIMNKLKKFS